MQRLLVLSIVISVGLCSMALSGQAPAGPSAAAVAAMQIEKVKDNLYIVTGAGPGDTFSGGNTAVFVSESGVTLVDTKLPGFGQALLDRIKTVTDKPVTRIINTHAHADHTGNNRAFGASVQTIVHENTDATMRKARNLLPRTTYKDRLIVGSGKDQIDLYYFGRGHTDGDAFVVFPARETMHVGDMFPWKALPFIDTSAGGSVLEHAKSLAAAVAIVKNVDTIINGHAPCRAGAPSENTQLSRRISSRMRSVR